MPKASVKTKRRVDIEDFSIGEGDPAISDVPI